MVDMSTGLSTSSCPRQTDVLRGHSDSVLCLSVAPDSSLLISGSEDKTARLWDRRQRKSTRAFVGFSNQVNSVCFGEDRADAAPSTVYVASGGQVSAFDLRRPELVLREPSRLFAVSSDEINQIETGGRGRHLAAGDDSGELKIVDLDRGALFKTVRKAHSNLCTTLAFHPRKPWQLASGGMDCAVVLWDYSRPKRIASFSLPEADSDGPGMTVNPPLVHRIGFNASGSLLAAALGNGSVSVWSVPAARPLCCAPLHRSACCQVLFPPFAPDDHVLTAGDDGFVVLSSLRKRSSNKHDPELMASEVWRLRLGRKPNWLAATADGSVLVADSSAHISVFACADACPAAAPAADSTPPVAVAVAADSSPAAAAVSAEH
eukprot:TRINITY_DN11809_c0_g1_i1.p1 TRINITY_DN11809_c0_g1~~TRINITY_DN11809_c0_g1_i1.p1  ORF type:complete len:376 (+),score=101.02 TRINITY_DN11809_c0_g1_i1:57-1184(+)